MTAAAASSVVTTAQDGDVLVVSVNNPPSMPWALPCARA
jgi:hypothetical protein